MREDHGMGKHSRDRRAARTPDQTGSAAGDAAPPLFESLPEIDEDLSSAESVVQRLFAAGLDPVRRQALGEEALALSATALEAVAAVGWNPEDLGEIVRRRLSPPP